MNNENGNSLKNLLDSNFTLFNLKLRATQIKNCNCIQNSINSLMNFVDSNRLGFGNP